MGAFAVAGNLADGRRRHAEAPPSYHGRRKARRVAGDVQPIPRIDAQGDGDRIGVVVVVGYLVAGEETVVNRRVPAAACGRTMQLTLALLVIGCGWLGLSKKRISTVFYF